MNQKETPNEKKSQRSAIAHYSGLGFQMLGIIAIGTWFGIWLDGENPEFPLYTLVGSLSSVFIALYLVIRDVIKNDQ